MSPKRLHESAGITCLVCAMVLGILGLSACVPTASEPDSGTHGSPGAESRADESSESAVPPGSVERLTDEAGREPADAFAEHIAAVATGDPQPVWESYGGTPPSDYDTWAAEWEDAAEVYESSAVLEQRVIDEDLAEVRVIYRVRSGDDVVEVVEPGEWWRIVKVDGLWKVGWLPRQ